MIGSREVALYRESLLYFLVAMELGSVVEGDSQETLIMFLDSLDTGLGNLCSGPGGYFLDNHEASGTLNQRNDTVMTVTTDDGITLPVADLAAGFNFLWPI